MREKANNSLSMDLEDHLTSLLSELKSLMRCKKILRDDGDTFLLRELQTIQELNVRYIISKSIHMVLFIRCIYSTYIQLLKIIFYMQSLLSEIRFDAR